MLDGGEESMFILLKSGAMLNLLWVQDCFQGKHDKNIVIFYTVNGNKLIEEYDTEVGAAQRVSEVHHIMDNIGKHVPIEGVDVFEINGMSGNVTLTAADINVGDDKTILEEIRDIQEDSKWVDYD